MLLYDNNIYIQNNLFRDIDSKNLIFKHIKKEITNQYSLIKEIYEYNYNFQTEKIIMLQNIIIYNQDLIQKIIYNILQNFINKTYTVNNINLYHFTIDLLNYKPYIKIYFNHNDKLTIDLQKYYFKVDATQNEFSIIEKDNTLSNNKKEFIIGDVIFKTNLNLYIKNELEFNINSIKIKNKKHDTIKILIHDIQSNILQNTYSLKKYVLVLPIYDNSYLLDILVNNNLLNKQNTNTIYDI